MRFFFLFFLLAGTLFSQIPELDFLDDEGQIHQLSSYHGEVVYLSVWASWCGPCIRNFEKYKPMRDQLEKEGVRLINISIDANVSDWEKALKKYDFITGDNGLATQIDKTKIDFNITKTPDYHIINKTGEFVYLSDNPQRNIISEFKAWLE